MKYTLKDVKFIFDTFKDKPPYLAGVLKNIFRDPQNMTVFSEFFFPHIITTTPPQFHDEIYNFFLDSKNKAFAAPRGHGKSSISTIFIIYNICYKLKKYIVYMSQNYSKTVQFIEPVRAEFKDNKVLQFVYGNLTPKTGRDDSGRDREDCFDVSDTRLEAVSFEKNIRGFKYKNQRPDLIIGDDIEDDIRVLNPDLRLKDSNKLNKAVIPSLSVDGVFKFIGTILHQDSLLKNKITQYEGKIYKSIEVDDVILMPLYYTKEKLMLIKKDIGSVSFESEYQNNPVDTTNSLIRPEWIRSCFREDYSSEELQQKTYTIRAGGVDFAFSDRVTADNSAYAGVGKQDDHLYLFYAEETHGMSVGEQMLYLQNNVHIQHRFDLIGMEENSIISISKDIKQYKLPIRLYWTAARDPAAKKPGTVMKDMDYKAKRYTVGKMGLVMRLGTAFENERFIIPYKTEKDKKTAHRILAECTSFALNDGKLVETGVHADFPIAIGYALEVIDSYKTTAIIV